jgi:hypothetical protein
MQDPLFEGMHRTGHESTAVAALGGFHQGLVLVEERQ